MTKIIIHPVHFILTEKKVDVGTRRDCHLPAMIAVLCPDAGWAQWRSPDIPCTHFFSSEMNTVVPCYLTSIGKMATRLTTQYLLALLLTAISRNVVGKSARDNHGRYCGWLWGHCSSKKFERMVREATDICLRGLKESNKSRFVSFSRYGQCIDHIPYYLSGLSCAYFFRQPFSKQLYTKKCLTPFCDYLCRQELDCPSNPWCDQGVLHTRYFPHQVSCIQRHTQMYRLIQKYSHIYRTKNRSTEEAIFGIAKL